MSRVLFLTGTGRSGKSTFATLLSGRAGWERLSEEAYAVGPIGRVEQ